MSCALDRLTTPAGGLTYHLVHRYAAVREGDGSEDYGENIISTQVIRPSFSPAVPLYDTYTVVLFLFSNGFRNCSIVGVVAAPCRAF